MSRCRTCMLPAIVALAQRHAVHALIRPVDGRNPDAPSRLATLLAQPGPAVQDKIARLWGGFVRSGLDRALLNRSGVAPELPPAVPIVEIPHWRINAEATAALIASYAPHLLVVFGAPLLARAIHALPYAAGRREVPSAPRLRPRPARTAAGTHCLGPAVAVGRAPAATGRRASAC